MSRFAFAFVTSQTREQVTESVGKREKELLVLCILCRTGDGSKPVRFLTFHVALALLQKDLSDENDFVFVGSLYGEIGRKGGVTDE